MKKFTKREKVLLVIVAFVVVTIMIVQLGRAARQGFSGGTLADKRNALQTARELVSLSEIIERIGGNLRENVGLQGQIISDSLFDVLSSQIDLDDLNRVQHASGLAVLHPALGGKADTLAAFKKRNGDFKSLDELKNVRGPIFEGEQPEAVISRRIAILAGKAGLRPNYQLNMKARPGRNTEAIASRVKRSLVVYLYSTELNEELKQLQARQKAIEEESNTRMAAMDEEASDAMLDAWLNDDKSDAGKSESTENSAADKPQTEGEVNEISVDEQDVEMNLPNGSEANSPTNQDSQSVASNTSKSDYAARSVPFNRQFIPLPEVIDLPVRIQLIQFIQHNLKLEMAGAAESNEEFVANEIASAMDVAQRKFFGFGSKRQTVRVQLRPDSELRLKLWELVKRHESEQRMVEGVIEETVDFDKQLIALTAYVADIQQRIEELQGWFAEVPSTYQPEKYIVEMNFKGEMGKIVELMRLIESSSRWFFLRDLRISIADRKETVLSADLSMIAKVL